MDDPHFLSEHVERAVIESLHEAAPPELRARLGLHIDRIGTATVSLSTRTPHILLNRTIGLGIDAPATRVDVEAIANHYRHHGVDNFYLHLHPEARPAELRDWARDAGLERGRGWMKFRRDRTDAPAAPTELEARRIDETGAGDFGRIVAAGFGMSPKCAPLLAALVRHPGWRLYLAYDGAEPAGAAALFSHRGAGWLDWAATRVEYRSRGAQSALLRRRILDALAMGCEVMFTETGEAVAGEAQHSYRNIERAGFEQAYVRENLVPAAERIS